MNIPETKLGLLNSITADLKNIPHIKAIVLGGSYAMGMATDASDLDIGIYYSNETPFDIEEIKSVARKYAGVNVPTVTDFYEWGPWVNGGAWIKTESCKIDLLYKNIEQVTTTIENAKNGIWENHFEQQPPFGFSSIIFLAETKCCIPLHDPENIIGQLKAEVQIYPEKLKHSVMQQSLWAAEFTIWQAGSFAGKKDIYNTVGCLTRAVKNIVTTLFALNEIYPMGDKRAIEILATAEITPPHLAETIKSILCVDQNNISPNVDTLKKLFTSVVDMTDGGYRSFYNL